MADDAYSELVAQYDELVANGGLDDDLNSFMANEVVPVWQGYYPVDTGEGRESIQVTKPAQGGKGEVSATDEAANIIEYGSEDTDEYAPRARTEEHFASEGL